MLRNLVLAGWKRCRGGVRRLLPCTALTKHHEYGVVAFFVSPSLSQPVLYTGWVVPLKDAAA